VGADGTAHSQFMVDTVLAIAKHFGSELVCAGELAPMCPEAAAESAGLKQYLEFQRLVNG
jgi:hypothetical protein